ncbi:hypothetical protein AVEN_153086-1 [Araneus ventricosus]|uniref:Uncharacterized protein n=1 Tax=Araneus ventricosus TaxID=182803 RepID=A0A4Y2E3N3_ARAVE|nr:hypothetical protein AVEN_153086-1 [Araneus ventricosus]
MTLLHYYSLRRNENQLTYTAVSHPQTPGAPPGGGIYRDRLPSWKASKENWPTFVLRLKETHQLPEQRTIQCYNGHRYTSFRIILVRSMARREPRTSSSDSNSSDVQCLNPLSIWCPVFICRRTWP